MLYWTAKKNIQVLQGKPQVRRGSILVRSPLQAASHSPFTTQGPPCSIRSLLNKAPKKIILTKVSSPKNIKCNHSLNLEQMSYICVTSAVKESCLGGFCSHGLGSITIHLYPMKKDFYADEMGLFQVYNSPRTH